MNIFFKLDKLLSKQQGKLITSDMQNTKSIRYKLINKISKWNNTIPCRECGSTQVEETPVDYINHMVSESVIKCARCNTTLNYWAYGSYEEPTTRLGQMGFSLYLNWTGFKRFFTKGH